MPRLGSSGNLWNDRMAAAISSRSSGIADDRQAAQGLPEGRSLDGNYMCWWKACQRNGGVSPLKRGKLQMLVDADTTRTPAEILFVNLDGHGIVVLRLMQIR